MKKVAIAIIAILGGLFLAGQALALTISPPRLELTANPGQQTSATIKLINETDKEAVFYSSAANFTAAEGQEGVPKFYELEEGEDGLAKWFDIEKGPIAIGASETREISFIINVPANADPGGHYAALFFGNEPPGSSGSNVSVAGKIGVLVLLRVSGEIKEGGNLAEFRLKDAKASYDHLPVGFSALFENSGNIHLKPQGEITITNLLGMVSEKIPVNKEEIAGGRNVLPGTSRHLEAFWTRGPIEIKDSGLADKLKNEMSNFAFGRYKASLSLGYGSQGKKAESSLIFWVFPWHLILALAILAAILIFAVIAMIKGYNNWIIKKAMQKMDSQN